jgi:hypothetical protein
LVFKWYVSTSHFASEKKPHTYIFLFSQSKIQWYREIHKFIEYSDIENLHVGKLAGRNIIILVSTKCSINKTNKCVLQYKKQSSRMVVQYHNCGKSIIFIFINVNATISDTCV